MVSTSDFNWTLPHGRMQFCHLVTYDRVLRTISRQSRFSFVRSKFEIQPVPSVAVVTTTCNFWNLLNPLQQHTVSLSNFLNAEKIVVVLQPSAAAQRYAGSTHTDSGNCWYMPAPISDHPDRPDLEPPGNRTHAGVYPPVGNFWCATMHCSSEPRSCRSGTVRSSAGH